MIRFRLASARSTLPGLFLQGRVAAADLVRTHSASAAPPELTNQAYCKPFPRLPPAPPSLNVAIFWDLLTIKPPKAIPIYDAAVRLRLAASQFGPVRHSIAFCPPSLYERCLFPATQGKSFPTEPCVCGVCGRRFFDRPKLLAHFKELHQREHGKRLRRLESAKGARRVNLLASMAANMEKYRKAAAILFSASSSKVIVPTRGGAVYELADELRRAGVRVRRIPAGLPPDVVSRALTDHVGEVVHRRAAGCLVLVSADPELVRVVRDARACGIKTVVVGDLDGRQGGRGEGGMLKRLADAGFTWQEVLSGKARNEAPKVTGRWKDKELLGRLEWKYQLEEKHDADDADVHDDEDEDANNHEADVSLNQQNLSKCAVEADGNSDGRIFASVWKTDDQRPWWDMGTIK